MNGATKCLEYNKLVKENKFFKKQNTSFFFVFDSFLADIDPERIREKIEKERESFQKGEVNKLESFLKNYDMVTRCCETFFFPIKLFCFEYYLGDSSDIWPK